MGISGGKLQILALGLVLLGAVAVVVSGVQAQQTGPVCNVFIAEEANKILFSETDLNDFNIAGKLRREKKTGSISFYSPADIIEIGSDRVSVPSSTVSQTDFLVQVTETIIPTVAPAAPKTVWKTVIWTGAHPDVTPKLVKKSAWTTEIDATEYSKSESYRGRMAYNWLSAFPACR